MLVLGKNNDPRTAGAPSESERLTPRVATSSAGHALRRGAGRLLLCTIAVAPFLGVYVRHYAVQGVLPTGFIQWDMPYYNANGRAVFERGNGVAYPNAYDPSPSAPVIYFHWLVWGLGFGIVELGLDPGAWFVCLGIIGSLACAWLTLRLVEVVLPNPAFRTGLFLLTMWGGGLFCLARAAVNLAEGGPLTDRLLLYDPFDGDFYLNWGLNLMIPTEAVYHALVAASWLGVLTGRWAVALGSAAAMAATHPFTGLQLLLMLAAWSAICAATQPDKRSLLIFGAVAIMLALFAWYYGWFLELYPQHRELRKVWSLGWTLPPLAIFLAYGPVGILATLRLAQGSRVDGDPSNQRPHRTSAPVGFLVAAFCVSFVLANHQWFMAPRQPLHFTHGYIWMPLWLLGLPVLQRWYVFTWDRLSMPLGAGVIALAAMVTVSDNLTYLATRKWFAEGAERGLYLTAGAWDMLRWMRDRHLTGVIVGRDAELCYLCATYTSLRPFYGHYYNTPHYQQRLAEANAFFERGIAGPWLRDIDYIVIGRSRAARTLDLLSACDPRPWRLLYENADYSLLTCSNQA